MSILIKLLVIDDEPSLLKNFVKLLSQKNIQILTANNGQEGLEMVEKHSPHIIITDVKMPVMDGLEFLKKLREKQISTPVILMTAFSEALENHNPIDLGADAFLEKPFTTAYLNETILELFKAEQKKAAARAVIDLDPQFHGINVSEFVDGSKYTFPIYLRLSKSKYIKIAAGGEDFTLERIQRYQKKGVHLIYFKKEDYESFLKGPQRSQ